jgi:adenylate kinase
MKLILLGAPGVGKGTQGELLIKKYNILKISTGDILRQAIKDGTELGKKAKEIIDKGHLVSDDIILGIVDEELRIEKYKNGFILDGFPRTIPQAEGLDKILKKLSLKIDAVVDINVPEDVIIKRLSSRRLCSVCKRDYNIITNPPNLDGTCKVCGGKIIQRDDDKEETIKKRLEIYRNQTEPLKNYYHKEGLVISVNGNDDVENVFNKIVEILERKKHN